MDHPESPSMEPSLLFHSSPRLLEDFNRWNNNTTPDHSRLAVEAWVPFNSPSTSYSPPMIAPSTSYSSPTSNSSELYLQPAFRAYSPLLNSPLSPTDTFQLLPAMNYLQGSPVHFTPAPTSTYSHHSDEASHYSDEASHYSDDGSNQRWTKNHSYNSPPQSSPTRSKSPYPTTVERETYGACKPFILKLGFLLSRPDLYGDVAKWDSTGTSFIITVGPRLLEVFQELFSHSSVTAFTRQLTTYSFNHLKPVDLPETEGKSGKNLSIWRHQYFTRDDTSTLNRLLPRPSRARAAEKRTKVERGTLENFSAEKAFLNNN